MKPPKVNPSHDDWVSTEKVTRYIAEQIWASFPYPAMRDGRVVWEYGLLEQLVDVVLHPVHAPTSLHDLRTSFMQNEPEATLHVIKEARKIADKLAKKRKAFALYLLGIANAPRPRNLTKSGAFQALAAQIYDLDESEFARCLETAREAYKKEQKRINAAEAARLNSVKNPGIATKTPESRSKISPSFRDNRREASVSFAATVTATVSMDGVHATINTP